LILAGNLSARPVCALAELTVPVGWPPVSKEFEPHAAMLRASATPSTEVLTERGVKRVTSASHRLIQMLGILPPCWCHVTGATRTATIP
jgi:hypothetical protein